MKHFSGLFHVKLKKKPQRQSESLQLVFDSAVWGVCKTHLIRLKINNDIEKLVRLNMEEGELLLTWFFYCY